MARLHHLTVESCMVAGAQRPAPRETIVAAGEDLEQLQDTLAAALGLSGLSFTLFDAGFDEWCAPSSVHDLPASSAEYPVRIRVQATSEQSTAAKATQPGRRIMLMVSRNSTIRGLETNKKIVVVAEDLDNLIAQMSTKLRLPPGIVVGRSARSSLDGTTKPDESLELTPFSCLDEIGDKARVCVWQPATSAALGQQPGLEAQASDSVALAEGVPASSRARRTVPHGTTADVATGTHTTTDDENSTLDKHEDVEHTLTQPAHEMMGAVRSNFSSELEQLKNGIGSSQHATEAAKRMKAAAARLENEREELLARLREQCGGDITPQAFLGMLREDRQFGDQLKTLVLQAISDTICGLTLPTIQGERDWGTFEVSGLAVKALGETPKLNVDIQTGVRVEVLDISIDFEPFHFKVDRHTTPKVRASGTGTASCVCSAFVAFSVTTGENKKLEVSDLTAEVHIKELPMQVLDSSKKVAVAAALKVFSKRGKEAVQEEIRQKVQEKMPAIQAKISALTTKFSGQERKTAIADSDSPTMVVDSTADSPTVVVDGTAHGPDSAQSGSTLRAPDQSVPLPAFPTATSASYLKPGIEPDAAKSGLQPEPEPALEVVQHSPAGNSTHVPLHTPADIRVIQQTMNQHQGRIADTWSSVQRGVDVTVQQIEFRDLLESFVTEHTVVHCDNGGVQLAGSILLSHTGNLRVPFTTCETVCDELQEADRAQVIFDVPFRAQSAQLLVFVGDSRGAPVQGTVNSSVRLGQYNQGYCDRWASVDVPGDALRVGSNVVEFSGEGHLFVDEASCLRGGVLHSQRSFDAGETFHVGSLGQDGQVRGEYRVRLRLQGVRPRSGCITSPVVDCACPAEILCCPDDICIHATKVSISCRAPSGSRIEIAARSGTTPQYRPNCWTDFASSGSIEYIETRRTLAFEVSTRAIDRYVQVQLTLNSTAADRLVGPEVYSITIESAVSAKNSNSNSVTVLNSNQPVSLARSWYPFKSPEGMRLRRLNRLRKMTGIERFVSDSLTDLEQIERLRLWTQSQWLVLNFDDTEMIDSLDPIEIWTATRAGWGRGDKRHYAALFVGVSNSLGFPSRIVVMGQHWVAEVYSTEHKKWICHDFDAGQVSSCVYFCRAEDKHWPMSALELHQSIVSFDVAGIYAHITDVHGHRQEALENDVFSIVTHIQAVPSFGLLPCNVQDLVCPTESCFDNALWFSRSEEMNNPFAVQTSRLADIDYSVNEIRMLAQQVHATADEKIDIASGMAVNPLVKVQIQLEHTCVGCRHFRVRISRSVGSVEEAADEPVEFTEQQLPLELWLSRGSSTISAWAIDSFGKECATASIEVVCSLRPEAAASQIRAAWKGYLVRHSSELRHVQDALARLKAPKTVQVEMSATRKRSLLTATIRVHDSTTAYVVYTVCVFDGGKLLVTVSRRYSEFHTLRGQILEILHGHFIGESAALIQFPPKATVRGKTSEKLTQQRAQTLKYVWG